MEKPDWVLWGDASKPLTLEQCVCLAMDVEPHYEPPPAPPVKAIEMQRKEGEAWATPVVVGRGFQTQQEANEALAYTHPALLSEQGKAWLKLLRRHYDSGQRILLPIGPYSSGQKIVLLYDFANWARAMKWDVPQELDITLKPAPAIPAPEQVAESVAERRARYLKWHSEEQRINPLGALQRVFEREVKQNPKADRGNIGKDIRKARETAKTEKQAGAMFGQLMNEAKRKG